MKTNFKNYFSSKFKQHIMGCLVFFSFIFSKKYLTASVQISSSIAPLALIVEEIIQGLDEELHCAQPLISHTESIHETGTSFSKIYQCHNSKIIFWISPQLEEGLIPLFSQFSEKTIELGKIKKLRTWLKQTDSVLPCCHHFNDTHHHKDKIEDLARDWHLWYSPTAVKIIAQEITEKISEFFPNYRTILEENLKNFLERFDSEIARAQRLFEGKIFKAVGVSHYAYRHLFKALNLPEAFEFSELEHSSALSPKKFFKVVKKIKIHKIKIFLVEWTPSPLVLRLKNYVPIEIIMTDTILDKMGSSRSYLTWFKELVNLLDECLVYDETEEI